MLRISFFLAAAALILANSGCVAVDSSADAPSPSAPAGTGVTLTDSDAAAIGKKIWKNECNGTVEGLTSWNAGEDFPSLGIGHFIWYVKGRPGPFAESFPQLIAYMKQRGVAMPRWVAEADGSPWTSRSRFLAEQNSPQMKELRTFLANTVSIQTGFIVQRLEQALPKMKAATSNAADKQRLHDNFYKVASTRTGVYALIDYVNFKGEGIKPEERYNGQGWGLRDVLLEMKPTSGGQAAANEYSEAAKRVLSRRIANSPSSRGESRWKAGWMTRCESYKHGI
ncbi:hypothetical protein VSU19_04270 [Verrucomicrobiales bacterium BCK34]|nr:hypothetical protein [Verrucomicrobiales bacterium BCK34]